MTYTYNVTATKFGLAVYQKNHSLTEMELCDQFRFWSVWKFDHLLERWNSQPESKITGLKWHYEKIVK